MQTILTPPLLHLIHFVISSHAYIQVSFSTPFNQFNELKSSTLLAGHWKAFGANAVQIGFCLVEVGVLSHRLFWNNYKIYPSLYVLGDHSPSADVLNRQTSVFFSWIDNCPYGMYVYSLSTIANRTLMLRTCLSSGCMLMSVCSVVWLDAPFGASAGSETRPYKERMWMSACGIDCVPFRAAWIVCLRVCICWV